MRCDMYRANSFCFPEKQNGNVVRRVVRSAVRSAAFIMIPVVGILMLMSGNVIAKPGTHGWAVSTWDTTRSTVVLNFEHGFMSGGGSSNIMGYNANFTSTTGRLSAQFGMQYLNLTPDGVDWALHGGAGSVVALYGIPIGQRYDNGMPKASFSIYAGSVPTVLSNGQYNYVTLPFVFGTGFEVNPIRHLSIVAWVEGAPSFNIDTVINYREFQQRLTEFSDEISAAFEQEAGSLLEYVDISYDENGVPQSVRIRNPDALLDEVLTDFIQYEMGGAFRMRGGLSMVLNLGDRLDLQMNGTVAQVGADFDASPTWFIGTALAFAWDDAPLGIRPEAHRASQLSCGAVLNRFEDCKEYQELVNKIRKEEAEKLKQEIVVHINDNPQNKQPPAEAAVPRAEQPRPTAVEPQPETATPTGTAGTPQTEPPAGEDTPKLENPYEDDAETEATPPVTDAPAKPEAAPAEKAPQSPKKTGTKVPSLSQPMPSLSEPLKK
jgi:hypothetical protein